MQSQKWHEVHCSIDDEGHESEVPDECEKLPSRLHRLKQMHRGAEQHSSLNPAKTHHQGMAANETPQTQQKTSSDHGLTPTVNETLAQNKG